MMCLPKGKAAINTIQYNTTGDTNIVHYNFFGLQVEFYFTSIYFFLEFLYFVGMTMILI